MKEVRTHGGTPIGASSLLVIFAVLCLTVFTLLALSTAQAGDRLSAASAEHAAAYYAADAQAHEILAQLRAGEVPADVTASDGAYSYACAISDRQALAVTVAVDGDAYRILRWQTVRTADWTPDETLDVWDGEELE